MTTNEPIEAASNDLRDELLTLAREVSDWTSEERVEAIETLGGIAVIAGTVGHADHVRTAEALSRLRKIIRLIEDIGEDDPEGDPNGSP